VSLRAQIDNLSSTEVQELIAEHLRGMHENSPPCHVHALAIEGLRQPDITFWSVWDDHTLCGCGALKEIDGSTGKSSQCGHAPRICAEVLGSLYWTKSFAPRVAEAIDTSILRRARERPSKLRMHSI
jgi:hypothetical protein